MNLNRKIQPFTKDGIPAYNQKFAEITTILNWLAGMRTVNGPPIRDSDQGPVIDLSQVATTQIQPWAFDPNGNPAGWVQHNVCENGQVVSRWFWGT